MNYLFLVLILLAQPGAFAQNNNIVSWYKMIKGKTGKYPVTMHLHKASGQYFGYYYYDSQEQPMYFTGEDTSQRGKITLTVYPDPDVSETFALLLARDSISGTWTSNPGKTSLAVTGHVASPPVRFQYVYTEGNALLRPTLKNVPDAHYFAASAWPSKPATTFSFIENFIRQSFSPGSRTNKTIGTLLLEDKKRFFAVYRKEYEEMSDQEVLEATFPLHRESATQLMIVYQSPAFISFGTQQYTYTGGAHGNYGTTYATLDLRTGKKLLLDQVVTTAGRRTLQPLLEAAFRAQRHLKPTDSLTEGGLFENRIAANKNFYVTGKGIAFNFVPYEIGPYAMGEVYLFIPFTKLSGYLQPAFLKQLGKTGKSHQSMR